MKAKTWEKRENEAWNPLTVSLPPKFHNGIQPYFFPSFSLFHFLCPQTPKRNHKQNTRFNPRATTFIPQPLFSRQCTAMERRKTLTMNWDGLGDVDDDDAFFESYNRLSTAVPQDLASSSDDDDGEFDDPRLSFASAVSSSLSRQRSISSTMDAAPDYGVWMAAPVSINERRKRLLHGMGLDDDKEFSKATPVELGHSVSKHTNPVPSEKPTLTSTSATPVTDKHSTSPATVSTPPATVSTDKVSSENSSLQLVIVRSRSEGDIELFSIERSRREDFIGKGSKQRLTRTVSETAFQRPRWGTRDRAVVRDSDESAESKPKSTKLEDSGVRAFFLIKNLDTGTEFIVNECTESGAWNRLSDLQTGKQLSMEEFEKTVGKSRVVNELMRRGARNESLSRKLTSSSYISRSLRMSKRRGAAFLKNIKGVASGFIGEREREAVAAQAAATNAAAEKSQWVRVRQSGKSHKEVSALHLCQEIQGHEGSVWTIRFSLDGRFLASAGEDKVINVWEVQECEVMSLRPDEGSLTPIHPSLLPSNDLSPLSPAAEKKKKTKFGSKRGPAIPEYVHVPETVFSLSDKLFCTFEGHSDDVLDLSWSKSQVRLSHTIMF